MNILTANVSISPFRNITTFPTDEHIVDILVGSMEETGWWQNTPARVTPGQDVPEGHKTWDAWIAHVETLAPMEQLKETKPVKFQLHAGAHRLVAINKVGFESIKIPVIQVDDQTMMKIMALENQENRGGQPLAIIESVEVVMSAMMEQVKAAKNWTEYQKKFKKDIMINSKKKFDAVKKANLPSQGVLVDFFGAKWNRNILIATHEAVGMIWEGFVSREALVGFHNINVVRQYRRLVLNIKESEILPPYFKEWYIDNCAARIREMGLLGRVVKAAGGQFKNGNDPYTYLKDEVPKPFNIKGELRRMIKDAEEGANPFDGMDGFDSEYMVTAIKEAQAEIDKAAKREEREAAKESKAKEMEADGKTVEEIEEVTGAMFAKEEAEEATQEQEESAAEDGPGLLEEGADAEKVGESKTSISTLTTTATSSLSVVSTQLERMVGRLAEIEGEKFPEFFDSLDDAFMNVVRLKAEVVGYKELRKLVTKIETNS